jgi:nucleotide-binding universal stress UspA family protein
MVTRFAPRDGVLINRKEDPMSHPQRPIICAVDESERAYEALAVARDLAHRVGRPLLLAHVVPAPAPFDERDAAEHDRDRRLERGKELLRQLAATLGLGGDTRLHAEAGDPEHTLRAIAHDEDAWLLVVGSRGRGRIRSTLFGSVSAGLIDGLACPMLVVTPGAAAKYRLAHERDAVIACGIDGASPLDEVVPHASEMGAALDARLLIVHADLPPMSATSAVPAAAGFSMAGMPRGDGDADAMARRRLDEAVRLAAPSRADVRLEYGELGTTMAAVGGDADVQMLVIGADSPWQRVAAKAGCPALIVPR